MSILPDVCRPFGLASVAFAAFSVVRLFAAAVPLALSSVAFPTRPVYFAHVHVPLQFVRVPFLPSVVAPSLAVLRIAVVVSLAAAAHFDTSVVVPVDVVVVVDQIFAAVHSAFDSYGVVHSERFLFADSVF